MNKNDLVAAVAEISGLGKADAAKGVDAVLEAVSNALSSGDDVRLVGFGTFSVSERKASEGRNPRTGETIQIAASKQPKFKAGKALKDAVNS
ncbi:DNA-binding protein HU [Sneathiella sp. P13V-1]|uniref:HU family DNA-binding protein n=1 Tax=Sneathiella sp. P13V-1 TaxID=2697366 RepID=UPI00187BB321|nr:HU family DNA-binding protein [Sneathiella sp. P13V-1]MBE7637604.1 DNA-binding protein HU [Sneathiella sp. P13V-1]